MFFRSKTCSTYILNCCCCIIIMLRQSCRTILVELKFIDSSGAFIASTIFYYFLLKLFCIVKMDLTISVNEPNNLIIVMRHATCEKQLTNRIIFDIVVVIYLAEQKLCLYSFFFTNSSTHIQSVNVYSFQIFVCIFVISSLKQNLLFVLFSPHNLHYIRFTLKDIYTQKY